MDEAAVYPVRAPDAGRDRDALCAVSTGDADLARDGTQARATEDGAGAPPAAGVSPTAATGGPSAGVVTLARESYAVKAARLDGLLQSEGLVDVLCQRLCEGESIEEIASAWDVPAGRLRRWLLEDGDRYARYRRALQIDAHRLVSEAVGICDAAMTDKVAVMRAKLRIETRFKVAGYHDSELYGEKSAAGGAKTQVNVIVQRSTPAPVIEPATKED